MSVTLTPVITRSGFWRVKLAWQTSTPRYFGKFDSQAEAEKWIDEHLWLTRQRQQQDEKPTDTD